MGQVTAVEVDQDERWIVAGTYRLDQAGCSGQPSQRQSRSGTIQLFDVELEHRDSLATHGNLDIKFLENGSGKKGNFLATGDSVNRLVIYKAFPQLERHYDIQVGSPGAMILSLDIQGTSIISSHSDGKLSLCDGEIGSVEAIWEAHHRVETWTAAWSPSDRHLCISGADDCTLKGWDIRNPTCATFVNSSAHQMGVTTVKACRKHPWILASGSYDEILRIWDIRQMGRPIEASGLLGGGIWRIKWSREAWKDAFMAVALCGGGAAIANMECQVTYQQDSHESLVYGIEWLGDGIITGSFYDEMLMWTRLPLAATVGGACISNQTDVR